MTKNVIFDLDGTLIDSAPSILKSLNFALSVNGISPSIPLTASIIGPPLDVTLRKITDIHDQDVIDGLIESFKNAYDDDGYKATVIYDGVFYMLGELLKSGIKIHLATNKRIAPTRKILNYFSLNSYFSSIYALDVEVVRFKSKAEMLNAILKKEGLNNFESLYVGDINADYEAAKYSDINFIHAQWGYEKLGHYVYPNSAMDIRDLTEKLLS